MTFILTALSETGPTLVGCDNPMKAMEKAREMIPFGYKNVQSAHERGVQYLPDAFSRLSHS